MSRPIEIGLQQIKTLLLKMSKLALDSIDLALKGFMNRDDVYVQIQAWSNTLLILSEGVDDRATEMITLHQPMARDLRTLRSYIKIAYDIERWGRYALDIADIIGRLESWEPLSEEKLPLEKLGQKTLEAVSLAAKLIETEDQSLIWTLSNVEGETDNLYLESLESLTKLENIDKRTVIAYVLTIRYLERIADHASYIAESITYASTGKRLELR